MVSRTVITTAVVLTVVFYVVMFRVVWMVFNVSGDGNDERENQEIKLLLEKLQTQEEDRKIDNYEIITPSLMKMKLKFPSTDNFVPNSYIHKSSITEVFNLPIVFVESIAQSKTESVIHNCISNITYNFDFLTSPYMDIHNRLLFSSKRTDTNMQPSKSKFSNVLKFYRGPYSFALCGEIGFKCNHFLLLEDPFERAVSSYEECKSSNSQKEICSAVNANKVTLRTWVMQHENVLLNQILLSPELCSSKYSKSFNISSFKDVLMDTDSIPCWFRHKLYTEDNISQSDIDIVAKYVTIHLSKWFTVIGMVNDLKNSFRMLENSFNLPFSKCNTTDLLDKRTPMDIKSNIVSPSRRMLLDNAIHEQDIEESEDDKDEYDDDQEDNDKRVLKNDVDIQRALRADMIIYKEAKRIFHIQKQVMTNKLSANKL